jgi:hypothetical protein
VRLNQTTLRADQYKGMVDAMQQDGANNTNFGRMVVLPATFVGSPRHMKQLYQDSMALVRKFGKPNLFITMTRNLNWPEILHELRPGEEANGRLDLTSRVFNMKLNAPQRPFAEWCFGHCGGGHPCGRMAEAGLAARSHFDHSTQLGQAA